MFWGRIYILLLILQKLAHQYISSNYLFADGSPEHVGSPQFSSIAILIPTAIATIITGIKYSAIICTAARCNENFHTLRLLGNKVLKGIFRLEKDETIAGWKK
jgi:hypothetical protein